MARLRKRELLCKSREAMLSAVQIYNNPHITFKSESFITLAVIAWTYLLHAYYANNNVDYRYYDKKGKRKFYQRTKHGAYKHWELERCLNEKNCPLDSDTVNNLKFLIGIRHEIEHQMTNKIDDAISAKIQACSINYNYYIKVLFDEKFGVDQELGLSIQFSPLREEQKNALLNNNHISSNIHHFIMSFEDSLTFDEIQNTHYAYRVVFTRIDGKRKNSATDEVITFLNADDPRAKDLNTKYAVVKEMEKKKYLSRDVVQIMKDEGYTWFTVGMMTKYWKNTLGKRDQYGIYVTKTQWMWYENWLPVIREFCEKEKSRATDTREIAYKPSEIVKMLQEKGYEKISIPKLNQLIKSVGIERNNPKYAIEDKYGHINWKTDIIPAIETYLSDHMIEKNKYV